MNDRIKEKLKLLTSQPGVYLMHDKMGTVIYVGKAKNLKNRVSQYFRNSPKPNKVQKMVDNIDDFEYFIAMSEMDALALENNLIKKYQPFYNILLKDGKQFPYIKIDTAQDFPKIEICRKVKKDGAKYSVTNISTSHYFQTITECDIPTTLDGYATLPSSIEDEKYMFTYSFEGVKFTIHLYNSNN